MAHENCIFCKIIHNEIPSYKIYEDDKVLAFLDLSQTTKGHCLVIPKKHLVDIFSYDEQTAADLFARIPKISRALELALPEMKGLNIVNNNKELAYQSVFHSHLHLIPRYSTKDKFGITFSNQQHHYSSEELQSLAQLISEQVK